MNNCNNCPECGSRLSAPASKFCVACGFQLKKPAQVEKKFELHPMAWLALIVFCALVFLSVYR